MRRQLAAFFLAGAVSIAPVLHASPAGAQQGGYRILDEERLLRNSRLGQQILAELRAAEQALEAENQRVSEQLAEEEAALTELRATLSPEEFRARANMFDARVETIRAERNALGQELSRRSDSEAQRFFETALPVLVQLMQDENLVAILKPDALILGAEWLDITDLAIARLDAALDGQDVPPAPEPGND